MRTWNRGAARSAAAALLLTITAAPGLGEEAPGIWKAYGPSTGGFIQTVAAHPSGQGPVLASMGPTSPSWPTGVHRSLDGGETWDEAAAGLPDRFYPQSIAFDRDDPNIAYAATSELYRTLDGGASWTLVGDGLPEGYVNDLRTDPSSGLLYAANAGGISRSSDLGGTWTSINNGLPEIIGARAIGIGTGGTLYVAVLLKGQSPPWAVYRSVDGAATWSATSLRQADFIYSQAVAPGNPSTAYVGYDGGVKVTRNGGASWSDASDGLPDSPVRSLLVLGAGTHALAGTSQGLFVTEDGGARWTLAGGGFPGGAQTYSLSISGGDSPAIYATTNGRGGVFRSVDGGASWVGSASGFPANVWVRGLATAPSSPGTAYAGAYVGAPSGAYRSTNSGRHWKAAAGAGLPTGSISSLAVSPVSPDIAFAGAYSEGVFRTVDGGRTWTKASGLAGSIEIVAVAPSNPQIVYAAGGNGSTGGGFPPTVYKSNDGGQTFTLSSTTFPRYPCTVLDLAVDPGDANTVYIAASFCGVFKSNDGGQSWLSVNAGIAHYSVLDVTIDPTNPMVVYAAVFNAGDVGGVWKSTTAGLVWTPALIGDNATSVVVDPTNPQKVYAALASDPKRVVRSVDAGATWTPLSEGFAADDTPVKMAIASDGKRLYVSTMSRGIYVTTPP